MAFTSSLDTAPSLRGVEGRAISSRGSYLRTLRTVAPVLPFLIYVIIGLGIPTYIIATLAFQTRSGQLTMHNIKVITSGGQYLLGFETSLKLAFVTALIPGVVGTVIAYAIAQSNHELFKRIVAAASGVLANFGGVNLAFMFVASLGPAGIATEWLARVNLNPYNHGWTLYKFTGVALVYMYFQVPLMVLVITPALNGLREQWREAAANLGASKWQYWRHVGLPVLTPPVLGSMFLLFGSGFSAYATTEALTGGTIALTPIQIGSILQGNVISGQENVGYALGLGMIVILLLSVVGYALLQRRTSRWLRP
ncbi:MAG: ABC transporter permease subunit [Actinomycetota bacterium]|jgi:putative spermidine/putrescine transport system permease protein|nr:ABC transporter permease subunit [Actinomycetota bacterium]